MKEKIIDTKLVLCGDGFIYHLSRTRKGIQDTISLTYPMRDGQKTIRRSIFSPLAWVCQKVLELSIDFI